MKQVVLIPCWRRPEFLGACLHYIQQAEGWEDNIYLFSIDRMPETENAAMGHSMEVIEVMQEFTHHIGIESVIYLTRPRNRTNGNSYNLLEGYHDAVKLAKENDIEIVTMIETDIFIGPDFFRWHSMVHERFSPFFASACRNQNIRDFDVVLSDDPADIFDHRSYQSLGVSWHIDMLEDYVLPHACDLYYRNMVDYAKDKNRFPIQTPSQWSEQDGIIYRVLLNEHKTGIFPHVPRAYHAGFRGYNRTGSAKGFEKSVPLSDRIAKILNMSEEEMNARATRQEFKDITKCSLLKYPEVSKLKLNAI